MSKVQNRLILFCLHSLLVACLLITVGFVLDIGKPGQMVSVQPILGYELVILGQAMYATPENIAKIKLLSESEVDKYSSLTAYKVRIVRMENYALDEIRIVYALLYCDDIITDREHIKEKNFIGIHEYG